MAKLSQDVFENQKLHEPKKNHQQKLNPSPSRVNNHKGLQAQILRDSKEQNRLQET